MTPFTARHFWTRATVVVVTVVAPALAKTLNLSKSISDLLNREHTAEFRFLEPSVFGTSR